MLDTLFFAAIAAGSIAAGWAMVAKDERWCRWLRVSRAAERPVLPELTLAVGFLMAAAVIYRVLTEPGALN